MELRYDRRCLLSFKPVAPPTLGIDVLLRVAYANSDFAQLAMVTTSGMDPGWPHRHVAVVFTEVAETESET